MPVEVLCRAQARFPCTDVFSHEDADPHPLNVLLWQKGKPPLPFFSYARAKRGGKGPALPGFPLSLYAGASRRGEGAPRALPLSLTLVRSTAETSACGHLVPADGNAASPLA